ncbi:hypothetical protein HPB47_018262 [Ixodes persulcatus]|uniref:Uncharacterized protein n=1 Tax=Ixodes persulcatus TaxID=34615 RepID=A0AC60QL79_IXOPE|nr:hypothetical protein HPB47_018262 [Ixodes persulcatus]
MHSDSDEYVDGDNPEWAQPDERGRKHRRSSDKWKRNVSKMKRYQAVLSSSCGKQQCIRWEVPGTSGTVAEELIRGQQRLVELAVARLAALEQQTSAIRQLTLVLVLLVLMTSATRQPCLPLPCRPPTPPPLD